MKDIRIETHKFGDYVPKNFKYLLLGSFTSNFVAKNNDYDWFYSNGRSQFWKLIGQVYNLTLETKDHKMQLCERLGLGITDIIYECRRTKQSSLDNHLEIISYNPNLENLVKSGIRAVYFSSRYVESQYKKQFQHLVENHPDVRLIYLPSPSPRYAAMTKEEKVEVYKRLLPAL